ncbi:MAG TPA: hypothetical protein VJX67_25005 [Blastocatellia bacterium]|nr:hypothetical protein [Blastocatellia bacterium]
MEDNVTKTNRRHQLITLVLIVCTLIVVCTGSSRIFLAWIVIALLGFSAGILFGAVRDVRDHRVNGDPIIMVGMTILSHGLMLLLSCSMAYLVLTHLLGNTHDQQRASQVFGWSFGLFVKFILVFGGLAMLWLVAAGLELARGLIRRGSYLVAAILLVMMTASLCVMALVGYLELFQ